jgi:hypothetical protein
MSVKMVFWAQLIEGEGEGARPSPVTLSTPPFELPRSFYPFPAKLARDSYLYSSILPLLPSLWWKMKYLSLLRLALLLEEGTILRVSLCRWRDRLNMVLPFSSSGQGDEH